MDKILKIREISASYSKKPILKNVSLDIETNKITAIIGPNGCGKSTLLKTITGFLIPQSGKVYFLDNDITNLEIKKRIDLGIGYMMQGGEIYKDLTVYENLFLGVYNLNKELIKERINEIYNLFPQLQNLANKKAGLLSGGEKQMLAFSIVIIKKPKLLLLDEPSAGLAPILVEKILKTIKKINITYNTTILIVEQNIKEVLTISDEVYMLKEGTILSKEKAENLKDNIEKVYDLFFK
ncbi:MAG: ABC transporter ATP-binding protein [Elusimicrobiales bacterium]|nr:ABC transporter ATP-binding protein [Elusimicrobiales bacterium]